MIVYHGTVSTPLCVSRQPIPGFMTSQYEPVSHSTQLFGTGSPWGPLLQVVSWTIWATLEHNRR